MIPNSQINKKEPSKSKQRARYVIFDFITANLAFWIFNIVRYYLLVEVAAGYIDLWSYLFSKKLIIEQCVVPVGMLVIYWLSGYYNLPFGKSRLNEISTTFFTALINTIIIYLVLLINDQTGKRLINYELILILLGLLFVLTYLPRLLITLYSLKHFRMHHWEFRVLIIGNSDVAHSAAERLVNGPSRVGYTILGFVDIPGEKRIEKARSQLGPVSQTVYSLDKVDEICSKSNIHQLILAPQNYDEKKILNLLDRLFPLNIPIKISPDTFSFVTSSIRLRDIYGEPFVDITSPALSESSRNIKRLMDVMASSLILIIFSPLYLILALLVKKDSHGPVIYRQERIGWRQTPFQIYKFRTMKLEAEKDGPMLSTENDPRITSVGKFMRKYRLDELPQFWNVLKGDMSIVGPRPEREFFIRKILEKAPYYVLVYQVRPGITSWGMVKYGYASNVEQMVERTRFDLIYLANMSLFVDIKILIYTIKTVVTGKGI